MANIGLVQTDTKPPGKQQFAQEGLVTGDREDMDHGKSGMIYGLGDKSHTAPTREPYTGTKDAFSVQDVVISVTWPKVDYEVWRSHAK